MAGSLALVANGYSSNSLRLIDGSKPTITLTALSRLGYSLLLPRGGFAVRRLDRGQVAASLPAPDAIKDKCSLSTDGCQKLRSGCGDMARSGRR